MMPQLEMGRFSMILWPTRETKLRKERWAKRDKTERDDRVVLEPENDVRDERH